MNKVRKRVVDEAKEVVIDQIQEQVEETLAESGKRSKRSFRVFSPVYVSTLVNPIGA